MGPIRVPGLDQQYAQAQPFVEDGHHTVPVWDRLAVGGGAAWGGRELRLPHLR